MNDKDKSYFIKLILIIVIFVAFLIVFGLTAELMRNKRVVNRVPEVLTEPIVIENEYFGNEFIQIKFPQKNTAIKSPVLISGKANVFEGNVRVRIKDKNENILADTFITASGAYDKLYPFEGEIHYIASAFQSGVMEVFEEDMKTGSQKNKIIIPVIFEDYYTDVSGWQIYRSEEYGFEIKYPKDWIHEENVFTSKPNLVFCPKELTEVRSGIGTCKLKKGATKAQYEDGMIYLFNYISDSKPNNSDYRYLGANDSGYYYLYSSAINNEAIFNQIISTFKFIDSVKEKLKNSYNIEIGNEIEKSQKHVPAEIKSIYKKNSITYFSIDILSPNPEFAPGLTPFFLNQSTKLKEVYLENTTKVYGCKDTVADEQYPLENFIKEVEENNTYYFDIDNNAINSVYGQCLP